MNRGMRLDYTIVDKIFFDRHVSSAGIFKDIGGSDHCPLWLSLKDLPPMPTVLSPPALSSRLRKRAKPQPTLLAYWTKPAPPSFPSPPTNLGKDDRHTLMVSPSSSKRRRRKGEEPGNDNGGTLTTTPSAVAEKEGSEGEEKPQQQQQPPAANEIVKAQRRMEGLAQSAADKKKANAKRKALEDPKQKSLLAFFTKKEDDGQDAASAQPKKPRTAGEEALRGNNKHDGSC